MQLSIIILNYNTSQLTLSCINTIKKFTHNIFYEIIVVDNGSYKDDYNNLYNSIKEYKNIKLIRCLQNLGFSSGNNKGINHVKGKYVCFMNSDILLIENSLKILYEFMENTKNAGACSGVQLNNKHKRSHINFGHYHNLTREILGDRLLELIFNKPNRKKIYSKPIIVDFCSGCLMIFKTSYYKMIGGFDNEIFLYYEEMDICTRLKKIYKLNTYHVPNTQFIHLKGSSTKIGYQKKIELIISHLYVIQKHEGVLIFILLRWFLIFKFLLKSLFKFKHFQLFRILITFKSPLKHSIKNKQNVFQN